MATSDDVQQILSDDELQLLDKQLESPTQEALQSLVSKAIVYISRFKDDSSIYDDTRAINIIRVLANNSRNNVFLIDELYKNSAVIIQFSVVEVLNSYINDLKLLVTSSDACSKDDINGCKARFAFMRTLLILTRNVTNESKAICLSVHDYGGTKVLLNKYFDDDEFIKSIIKFKPDEDTPTGMEFILLLMGVLYNLSTVADYRKKDFETLHASSIIEKFKEFISFDDHGRLITCITLANIVSDNNIENAIDTKSTIDEIVKLIRYGADMISLKLNLKRLKINVSSNSDATMIEEVCVLNDDWTIVDLLQALYRLAVIDKLKLEIYETNNIKIELHKIFAHGNNTEKEYAAKLLWQLCFDKRIAKKVQLDSQFFAHFIDESNRLELTENKKLKKYCKGIVWSIEKASVVQTYSSCERKHIMISYNTENRKECLSITQELESLGFSVWIDIEKIHGSSLEAMAKAIENSQCVLMCMTEKYKQSPNCRAEAEYAFKLNVPIIPIIMQQSYMPDGWLGIILGSKVFINFTKYPFGECMRRLMVEVRNTELQNDAALGENTLKPQTTTSAQRTQKIAEAQEVKLWTEADVHSWLLKSKFSSDIVKHLKNFNGELLYQLNAIRIAAPDYFYQTVSRNHKIDVLSVVYFVNELEKLFD